MSLNLRSAEFMRRQELTALVREYARTVMKDADAIEAGMLVVPTVEQYQSSRT